MTGDILPKYETHFEELENDLQKNRGNKFFLRSLFFRLSQILFRQFWHFPQLLFMFFRLMGTVIWKKTELIIIFSKGGINPLFLTELVVIIMGTIDYVYSFLEANEKLSTLKAISHH
jgi:hypothetical protein